MQSGGFHMREAVYLLLPLVGSVPDRQTTSTPVPRGFRLRNRSLWCDRCQDFIVEAADPLTSALASEHRRSCTGRMAGALRSNGWWMGGARKRRSRPIPAAECR
jgi:hypothetical protein